MNAIYPIIEMIIYVGTGRDLSENEYGISNRTGHNVGTGYNVGTGRDLSENEYGISNRTGYNVGTGRDLSLRKRNEINTNINKTIE